MKGIYLTEEGKKDIKDQILEYESLLTKSKVIGVEDLKTNYYIEFLKSILLSATILPVEESWSILDKKTNKMDEDQLKFIYNKGVIIKPESV